MPWKQFWKRTDRGNDNERRETSPPAPAPDATPSPGLPPHLASAFAERKRPHGSDRSPADDRARRLDTLHRRRLAFLYDVQQGEQAESEDNPWQQRIQLLTDALATVSEDLKHLADAPKPPFHPVPATPISIERVEAGDGATVIFRIGDGRFEYSEDLDWAERGHQIARLDLVHRSGDVAKLVPKDTPPDLRAALQAHLNTSAFVLATDLRDRAQAGEALPERITLADLAKPCPKCGGWMDWRGTCQACAQRAAATKELKREEVRLLDERAAEYEERHRMIERLPLARRRLRDIETEIAALTTGSSA
ncbi:MAG TPA: hypothetical protein VGR08_07955 [Thermomicrobiales bacterium]|nr:hypothetical protein [Thermomicrobiales bacterium]